ncbi:MAG TPA: hypothetical protein VNW24_01930, partial [Stellaceae bacterium]|nr:hypothetical protein [Stellaceae bacterium]
MTKAGDSHFLGDGISYTCIKHTSRRRVYRLTTGAAGSEERAAVQTEHSHGDGNVSQRNLRIRPDTAEPARAAFDRHRL